ncbi:MAG: nuclear transport factor 2 family protein [Hyphomicrobiales bacterium]|nr:nuclear transport factor 2 family protein [Hyphomicrobiales bacterium]
MASMLNRVLLVVLAVGVYGAAGAWLSSVVPAGAKAESVAVEAEARQAINIFFGAVMNNDEDAIAGIVAPEFQIQRANGTRYDAATYPMSELPIIAEMPELEDVVVTTEGDLMVATYNINVNETIDGKVIEAFAPRMTVFRKDDDKWLVVAHANFGSSQ